MGKAAGQDRWNNQIKVNPIQVRDEMADSVKTVHGAGADVAGKGGCIEWDP